MTQARRDCTTCEYRERVDFGCRPFCLHPKSFRDEEDPLRITEMRDVGKPCGPNADLHSVNELRSGYLTPAQWRTMQ